MVVHDVNIRVRYAETDQMGHVYHGNYAVYYEVARVETLRSMGVSYKRMEEVDGILLPVVENHFKFFSPARYDELLTVRTYIKQMPTIRMNFEYEVFNEQMRLIQSGSTVLVFVKKDTFKPCRVPQYIISLFEPHFVA